MLQSFKVRQKSVDPLWWFVLYCLGLCACTMPLPVDFVPIQSPGPNPALLQPSASDIGQDLRTPLEQIFLRSAWYQSEPIRYLDLNSCEPENLTCINRLDTPLNPMLRYEFFFSDGTPVLGQSPVFSTPDHGVARSPFRRVVRVIVPDGYLSNTIRSAQDVAASQFRTEETDRVLNNPLIIQKKPPLFPLTLGEAWSNNQAQQYLELGMVPYAAERNRLGVGVVYFMRNYDKTDLPSRPHPIFDTRPGDLLYSPIRQVFRAVSENQIDSIAEDPTVSIRSQDQLLNAVNEGLLRLEDTQEFFNYPVYQDLLSTSEDEFGLSLTGAAQFPKLSEGSVYTLWIIDQLNQARQIFSFRAEGSRLSLPNGKALSFGPETTNLFRFSRSELNTFRYFLVSIENTDVTEPTGSTLLRALYEPREQTRLTVPFAEGYSALQAGFYMLVAPTAKNTNVDHSGLWFIQRDDPQKTGMPLDSDLSPGLILALPPRGWVYNGWVLSDLRNPLWLSTGRFRAINQADQSQIYSQSAVSPYDFPGEDFLLNPPPETVFPLNLPSTGERRLVISLEPENLDQKEPFFKLFQTVILKGTPSLTQQSIPFTPVSFPSLDIQLKQN